MRHEIVGPEMTVITGQLRLPKREAIARHIAQYETRSMGMSSQAREEEVKRDSEDRIRATKVKVQLEALEFTGRDFESRKLLEKNLESLGIPNALAHNWIERDQTIRFRKLKNEAKSKDIMISIPFLENRDLKSLESEMDGMLKILNLPETVTQIIRKIE